MVIQVYMRINLISSRSILGCTSNMFLSINNKKKQHIFIPFLPALRLAPVSSDLMFILIILFDNPLK